MQRGSKVITEKLVERMLDKTLADSFPASDPPSTLPNPSFDSFGFYELVPEQHDLQDDAGERHDLGNRDRLKCA